MEDSATSFKYEEGVLQIVSPLQTLRIQWSAEPRAMERIPSGKWRDCSPEIRLLKPRDGHGHRPEDDKARAFEAFRQSVPPEIVRLVEPFSSHQWNMLVLLNRSDEAKDLAVSNPVLAYALANNDVIRNASERLTMCHAMRNVRKRRREICGALGLPVREACVRLMRKIPAESCSPATLRLLVLALARDPGILAVLGQLGRVHPAAIHMVSRADAAHMVTPRLLAEVGEGGESADSSNVTDMLFNMAYHAARMGNPPQIPAFSSVRAVKEFHDTMMLELEAERERLVQARERARAQAEEEERARRRRARRSRTANKLKVFPAPPLPGTADIVPVTTHAELRMEGREQHNCVGSYAYRVVPGNYYVYRVLKPQRATLAIRLAAKGAWRIDEVKCSCNRPVSAATRTAIAEWLDRHNASL